MATPSAEPNLTAISAELESLKIRLDALESSAPPVPASGDDPLWALAGLKQRMLPRAEDDGGSSGAVLLTGALRLSSGEPVEWQEGRGASDLLEASWDEHADPFTALGHPVRLELLRQVLNGVRTTAALAELEGLGTTGQLHHHLRQLLAAGWLRNSGRGSYEVPAARVVPLLVCVMAVA